MVAAKAKALGLDTLAQSVSIGYVIVFLIVLALVLVLNKTTKAKLIGGIVTVGAFALLPYWLFVQKSPAQLKAIDEQADFEARYEPAKALFEKLCKEQSQPIIKRTVEDVEGILLLKRREGSFETRHKDVADQMWAGAGLAYMSGGNSYLLNYLIDRRDDGKFGIKIEGTLGAKKTLRGFRFVDIRDVTTGELTRITATSVRIPGNVGNPDIQLVRTPLNGKPARYAVDLIDNVDPRLRKHWIAGTTFRVIDTATNEVIGEQTWWNWDTGFGNTGGSRSPWLTARLCPGIRSGYDAGHLFVDSILKAKQGN